MLKWAKIVETLGLRFVPSLLLYVEEASSKKLRHSALFDLLAQMGVSFQVTNVGAHLATKDIHFLFPRIFNKGQQTDK